jgi:hypothetical protein
MKFICVNCQKEIWKDIVQFEGYEISNLGKVRGKDRLRKGKNGFCFLKGKQLKEVFNKKGYPEVRFRKNGTHVRLIHRLVAKTFIPNFENKHQVNHINGIKTDNRVENLEWCTNSENQKHAFKLGLNKVYSGEKHPKSKYTLNQINNIKKLYNTGYTALQISNIVCIPLFTIRGIISGQTWKNTEVSIIKRDDRKNKINQIINV